MNIITDIKVLFNIHSENSSKKPILHDQTFIGFTTLLTQFKELGIKETGSTDADEAVVRQWLEYASCCRELNNMTAQKVLKELNVVLGGKTYLVGNYQTLADILMYYILYKSVSGLSYQEKELYLNVSRWFDIIQHDPKLRQSKPIVIFSKTLLYM